MKGIPRLSSFSVYLKRLFNIVNYFGLLNVLIFALGVMIFFYLFCSFFEGRIWCIKIRRLVIFWFSEIWHYQTNYVEFRIMFQQLSIQWEFLAFLRSSLWRRNHLNWLHWLKWNTLLPWFGRRKIVLPLQSGSQLIHFSSNYLYFSLFFCENPYILAPWWILSDF